MLGADDDPSGFEPRHPVLEQAWRRHPHWRLTRTGRVMEALTPAIIEQKVTGQEALAGFRTLVFRYGERAPESGHEVKLWVQPSAETIRMVPSWAWLQMHIDPARSRALVSAARYARNLERTMEMGADGSAEADRRMRALPGIGVWTSAEVRFRAFGDADAVSFGDYHVGKNIFYALTGEVVDDDERLAELLEPWRPHRYRVQRLLELRADRPAAPRLPDGAAHAPAGPLERGPELGEHLVERAHRDREVPLALRAGAPGRRAPAWPTTGRARRAPSGPRCPARSPPAP